MSKSQQEEIDLNDSTAAPFTMERYKEFAAEFALCYVEISHGTFDANMAQAMADAYLAYRAGTNLAPLLEESLRAENQRLTQENVELERKGGELCCAYGNALLVMHDAARKIDEEETEHGIDLRIRLVRAELRKFTDLDKNAPDEKRPQCKHGLENQRLRQVVTKILGLCRISCFPLHRKKRAEILALEIESLLEHHPERREKSK